MKFQKLEMLQKLKGRMRGDCFIMKPLISIRGQTIEIFNNGIICFEDKNDYGDLTDEEIKDIITSKLVGGDTID